MPTPWRASGENGVGEEGAQDPEKSQGSVAASKAGWLALFQEDMRRPRKATGPAATVPGRRSHRMTPQVHVSHVS